MRNCLRLLQNDSNVDSLCHLMPQPHFTSGRPSMYATNDNRAPQVINDRFLQHIFTNNRPDNSPPGLTAMVRYFVNYIFNFCYSTLTTIVTTVVSLFRSNERSKWHSDSRPCEHISLIESFPLQQLWQIHSATCSISFKPTNIHYIPYSIRAHTPRHWTTLNESSSFWLSICIRRVTVKWQISAELPCPIQL